MKNHHVRAWGLFLTVVAFIAATALDKSVLAAALAAFIAGGLLLMFYVITDDSSRTGGSYDPR